MSDPFVIWTMRRTGGTTFTGLLTTLSEHKGTQHEPFNLDRKFGHVTERWTKDGDAAGLVSEMAQVLETRPLIKHCYELVPEMVNLALIRMTTELGYRHIVLDRGAEVDRILSLELAKLTGAWGAEQAADIYEEISAGTRALPEIEIKSARSHMVTCAKLRRWLAGQFDTAGHVPLLVYFEEIYGDFDAGKRTVEEVLDCLGIVPGTHKKYDELVREALTEKAQNSQSIAHAVPNFGAARAVLTKTYEKQGFRFETATRSLPPINTGAAKPKGTEGLIFDIGAGSGDDTAFYLAKGFSVLSVPLDDEGADAIQTRLGADIETGHLHVHQADLTPNGGMPRPLLEDAITRHGLPRYIKVEGPGGEHDIVTGLTGAQGVPHYLSFQMNPDWQRILAHAASLGYRHFQVVRQGASHLAPPPSPAREGHYVPIAFTGTMSGCFGRELPPEDWLELEEFFERCNVVQARREEVRARGKKPGWFDIHCRLQS
ncbi:MAG: hypothetical protein AAFR53_01095 [Pseudomonadota bacterium]